MKNKLLVLVEDCKFIEREIVNDALDPILSIRKAHDQ